MSGLLIIAVSAVLFVGWNLYRQFGGDRIGALCETRRSASRIVSRGEFVDGSKHIEVALALTGSTFFYETADMHASLELQWVKEIEYDTHLTTGDIAAGRVLRLRCYNQVFEFVLPSDVVPRWYLLLPPRRASSLAVPDIAPELASA